MSIEFFGVGGLGQIGAMKKTEKTQSTNKPGENKGKDQVQFSSVLQDVQKAQTSSGSIQAQRNERVQELKAQIAEGSYHPDLNKVATSLLQFLIEEKQS
ncbi:MAG: flagellar biosynthesis anti-sigma factor FlgM [Proteobacteria bacterium]|nr:flagellar biosynthesis anti-sigma factor FlgM [Pseudomonadota bacterium]MBU1649796.1 flagellar biosynthesis anti-sigma factor FlgM [Pseudomonadota bacterium]